MFSTLVAFCLFGVLCWTWFKKPKSSPDPLPLMSRLAKRVKSMNYRNNLVDDPVARALALKNIKQRAITQELNEFTETYIETISAIENTDFVNSTGMLVPIRYDVVIPEVKDILLQSIPLYFVTGARIMSEEEWPQGLQVYAHVKPPPRYGYEYWEDREGPKKSKNYDM